MDGLIEGRMVHYISPSDGVHRAAVITKVWSKETGTVNLFVFPDGSYPLANNMPTFVGVDQYNSTSGQWHWIEKA